MTLVRRFRLSDEHAQLLSTASTSKIPSSQRFSIYTNSIHGDSADSSLFPSLAEVQVTFRRMQADPDLSQESIFRFCIPSLSLVSFIAACVLELKFRKAELLSELKNELVLAVCCFFAGTFCILALLRALIWLIASGVKLFVEMEIGDKRREEAAPELNQQNILLGIFS